MTTTCRACRAPIPTTHVSLELQAARCAECRLLQDLQRFPASASRQPVLVTPDGWTVETGPRSLRVEFGWWQPAYYGLAFFAVIWNGFLAAFAFGASDGLRHPLHLLYGLALPHVWVGIGLLYVVVASFVGRTTIRVGDGTITVRHAPLWLFGKSDVELASIDQIFVVEHVGNRGARSYDLCALDPSGTRTVWLRGLPQAFDARYLEAAAEAALHIEDRAVVGELPR